MQSTTGGPVRESTIRLMTRLAHEYKAVNLSQGFPNEPPPPEGVAALICGLLGGTEGRQAALEDTCIKTLLEQQFPGKASADVSLQELMLGLAAHKEIDLNS